MTLRRSSGWRIRTTLLQALARPIRTPLSCGHGLAEPDAPIAGTGRAAARRATAQGRAAAHHLRRGGEAGVSYSTVSRVVNGHAHVNEATRERVQAAMRSSATWPTSPRERWPAAGRRPSACWRRRSTTPSSRSSSRASTRRSRWPTTTCCCARPTAAARRRPSTSRASRTAWSTACSSCCPPGCRSTSPSCAQSDYPFVLIDHDSEAPGCNVVNAANRTGHPRGHRLPHRAWGTGASASSPVARTSGPAHERLSGYRDALAEAGIPRDERLVVAGDFLEARGYEAARELLALPEPPTAIFASSDAAAFGVLGAARDAGLQVPADLSVLGLRRHRRGLLSSGARRSRPCASPCARWAVSRCSA